MVLELKVAKESIENIDLYESNAISRLYLYVCSGNYCIMVVVT